MTEQTYRALMAVIRALTNDPKDIDELKAYGNLPVQVIVAVFDYAKEHAK